ncbi:MAG: hypothetical protein QF384_22440 [Alphaproteobacteria bacterium]|nr:hypothetical protein [Alphaproteobacteria bacterium]MDP6829457.1 hypothetical protein [Alphaproteobacteria bacterium]MDP6874391.1 hypothetical protein [Alphaproteobacteria bacterium]
MQKNNETAIWSTVALGMVLYVSTFIMAWDSTSEYRENVQRPMTSASVTVQSSLN